MMENKLPAKSAKRIKARKSAKARVMLCYSSEDGLPVRQVEGLLRRAGLDPVKDTYDLPVGMEIKEGMRLLVETSLMVVFVISHPSALSPNCLFELEHARALHMPIIPVTLQRGAVQHLPEWLRELKYEDLTGQPLEDAAVSIIGAVYQRLLADCA
ncbi:MAG: toll/interleukin-1 receptor domain-containing protein [Anaerolinea sp.]|nr:toll/interleukin-1 receptor domain-containing protein [Anaerolinea sp.]